MFKRATLCLVMIATASGVYFDEVVAPDRRWSTSSRSFAGSTRRP